MTPLLLALLALAQPPLIEVAHAARTGPREARLTLLQADREAQHQGLLGPVPVLRARLRALATTQAALQTQAVQWQALDALQAALQQPLNPRSPGGMAAPKPATPSPSTTPHSPPMPDTPHLSNVAWRRAASAPHGTPDSNLQP